MAKTDRASWAIALAVAASALVACSGSEPTTLVPAASTAVSVDPVVPPSPGASTTSAPPAYDMRLPPEVAVRYEHLLGTAWRIVEVGSPGDPLADGELARTTLGHVRFGPAGQAAGSDGCNAFWLSATGGGGSTVGCADTPQRAIPAITGTATEVRANGATLELTSPHGWYRALPLPDFAGLQGTTWRIDQPEDLRDVTISFPAPGQIRADWYDTFVTWQPTESNVGRAFINSTTAPPAPTAPPQRFPGFVYELLDVRQSPDTSTLTIELLDGTTLQAIPTTP